MKIDITRSIKKYKHPIIISSIVVAILLYALPMEKMFTDTASAQRRTESRDGPYGHARGGPPSDTPGQGPPRENPGQGQGPPEDRGPPVPRGPPS